MLDAIENGPRCAISEHGPSLNEINDLARVGENVMVRRNSLAGSPGENRFWG
jgi:hypothetical protein